MFLYRTKYYTGLTEQQCLEDFNKAKEYSTVFVLEMNDEDKSKRAWCSDTYYNETFKSIEEFKLVCEDKIRKYA